mmetsp:Transcript_6764/g.21823  ORF Transcript_6764/g.21823 Transcript_6764/m.21823 type:complete len:114 (+) Transcript_6764:21-362(+)|eukprot:CAMPEP_0184215088 /NCGR_PEP_ID=MMETSP0976-20121227/14985_1 /TAXON_ID=483370 /ORGANISM="non described non described, Strain CCMP2097" /LENGTH=113 /DNA_ID=CAMNT_0026519853 /DNA_START=30 /DNA_END=371 /DNA_ORIENTATION=+
MALLFSGLLGFRRLAAPRLAGGAAALAPNAQRWGFSAAALLFPVLGCLAATSAADEDASGRWLMNRNARIPKKANHGSRPCSHFARKMKVPRKGVLPKTLKKMKRRLLKGWFN